MDMQPILPVNVTIRKIKGDVRQHYVDGGIDVTLTLGVNKALRSVYT